MAWACSRLPVTPSGMTTSTPTPTLNATSTPTPTVTITPDCYDGTSLPGLSLPSGANLGLFNQTNPLGGAPFTIIRSQSDWDTLYGSSTPPAPPVNFNADMIIIVSNAVCCPSVNTAIALVCESASGVSITVSEISPTNQCYTVCPGSILSAVTVPNSNLPVTWTVTTNPFFLLNLTPVILSVPTPTATP
jgi:hypothetical protein